MGLFLKKISPYILSLIIGGSMAYIDSIFISHYYSNADFAIYRYGARELFFVTLMANAFSNAMSAELSTHHNNGNIAEGIASIKNRSTRLMHLLFPVTILLLLGSKYIFPLVFTAQFSASVPIFNIYLLLIISRLIFPQTVLLGIQKNKVLFRATAIEWVSNIILDAVFILFFMQFGHGMEGVAFATVLAYLLEKIILAWYCGKEGISFASYVPVKEWVLYSGITIGVYILASII